jgi:hypothetical protein
MSRPKSRLNVNDNAFALRGRAAASLLKLAYPSTFNRVRRSLERFVDPHDARTLRELPHFGPESGRSARQVERAFRRQHVCVVPAWGGVSAYGADYSYSLDKVQRWCGPTD